MFSKKTVLSLMILWPTLSAAAAHNNLGVDELKHRCLDLRKEKAKDKLSGAIQVKLLCTGSYTFWTREDFPYSLQSSSSMQIQTTSRSHQQYTRPLTFPSSLPPFEGTCSRYLKHEMLASESTAVSVTLANCEDLTMEKLESLCKLEIRNYCQDQHVVFQRGPGDDPASQLAQKGVCTRHLLDTLDTCLDF